MIDEKYVELINREIDGLNSEKESTELKEYLDRSPEAQQLWGELRAVSERLSEVGLAEPPEHLKTVIMNSIPKNKYVSAKKQGFGQSIAGIFALKPRFQFALTFSGGLAAGLLLFALFYSTTSPLTFPDSANLYGTLALQNISNKLPIADQTEFNIEQTQGTAILKTSDNTMFLEMDIHPKTDIEIQLDFNNKELSCTGFVSKDNNAIVAFNLDDQSVKFIPEKISKLQLFFKKANGSDPVLKMTIFESGNSVFQHTFARAFEFEPK